MCVARGVVGKEGGFDWNLEHHLFRTCFWTVREANEPWRNGPFVPVCYSSFASITSYTRSL